MSRFLRLSLLCLLALAGNRAPAAEPADVLAMRAKAEKGNGLAQYNLGLVYMQGQLVPVDLPEAFVWLTLASENGSTGKDLDGVLANLTDSQLMEGRSRLAQYRAAIAARAAGPTVGPPKKVTNRGFSLTAPGPTNSATTGAPVPATAITHAPDSNRPAAGPRTTDSVIEDLAQARQEIARLKAELEKAQTTIREQAGLIARLQDPASRPAAATVPGVGEVPIQTSPPDGVGRRP